MKEKPIKARLNKLVVDEADSVAKPFSFEVDYGERMEHCWNGDQENGNHLSRLRYNTMYLDKMMGRIETRRVHKQFPVARAVWINSETLI